VKFLCAEFFLTAANSELSNLTDNRESNRKTKNRHYMNKCRRQTFSGGHSQEFVIYNETGIDTSLIVAYNHKFRHQNKKTTVYRLLVCSFSLASITDVMSIIRRQQRVFPLFLLAAAKSALSSLTVKYRVLLPSLISAIRNLTASRVHT